MVLAENVSDLQGRLLVPEGTALTERHLRAFQMLGIPCLKVRGAGEEEAVAPVISPELRAAATTRLRERMQHQDLTHPAIIEIMQFAIEREARLMASGERPGA